ncbi:hypothetical protein INR49_015210 [Caranx melampygus]|nr:hypothetical protein INR49_015210 [Caranx melampygus]
MRFIVPVFVFLAVAAFHTALSASLETAEKEEKATQYVTEEESEETHFLEAVKDVSEEHVEAKEDKTAEGGGNSDAAAQEESQCESSEEADGRQRQGDESQDSTKDQDVLE